jgi:Tol biopolymer transport system component
LSAIGDARLELDETDAAGPFTSAGVVPAQPSLFARLWPAAAAVVLTAVAAALLWPSSRFVPDDNVTRLSVLAPPGAHLYPDSGSVALSPDGTMVAFIVGSVNRSQTELWVRPLDSTSARRLEGANGSSLPFWSPDSRRIGFFADGKLKTIAASGGRADVLCDATDGRGAAWSPSNVIVFAPDASGPLHSVPASGGTPQPVTSLDAVRKEYGHRFPTWLPDGRHFLYAALPGKAGRFDIFAGSLDDASRTLVAAMEGAPVYADPGWLLFGRQGVLAAQRFDPVTRQVTGELVLLPDEPSTILDPLTSWTAGQAVSVSLTGGLAYFSAPSTNTTAAWYDANGRHMSDLHLPPGHYEAASISPDGTQAALVKSTSPSESAVWLVDLARGGASPLSSGPGRNDAPVWSPDGARVVFAADRDGVQDLFVKLVGDASPEQPLYRSDALFKMPSSWSPDGQWIVVTQLDPDTSDNVWLLPATGKPEMKLLVRSAGRDRGGSPSPNGKWLAFGSDETGRYELYVQSFPEPGRRVPVSQRGGSLAWWTDDGRQLLFLGGDMSSLWRADVEPGDSLRIGTPRQIATFPPNIMWMDAAPDRQRFLAIAPERTGPGSLTIVQNWRAALRQIGR